jgi:cytochrome c553
MKFLVTDPGRQRPALWNHWALACLASVLALGGVARATFADEPDVRLMTYARQLAVGVCGTCHDAHGNSTQPKFPRLAGQNSNYLRAQLKAFREQSRGDPDAIGYMWGMASQLDDATIDALAVYYSRQRPEPIHQGDPAAVSRGREIFQHGVESEGVPACMSCHGPDGHGLADFPRIAGQHAQYVLKQLGSFKSNMRNIAVMHGVAQNLRVEEMESVADYLEAQP